MTRSFAGGGSRADPRIAPAGEAGARIEPLNVARKRQACSKENNPKPSAKKRARVYESSFSFALISRPSVIKRPLGLALHWGWQSLLCALINRPSVIKRPLGLPLLKRPLPFIQRPLGLAKLSLRLDKSAIGDKTVNGHWLTKRPSLASP